MHFTSVTARMELYRMMLLRTPQMKMIDLKGSSRNSGFGESLLSWKRNQRAISGSSVTWLTILTRCKKIVPSPMVSHPVSTASGILGHHGLALSPLTAGASLVLSKTCKSLGVTASMTSLMTTNVEEILWLSGESEASHLVGASMNVLEEILTIIPMIAIQLCGTGMKLSKAHNTFKDQIWAIKTARSISCIGAGAKKLTSTGRSSIQGVLPVARGARSKAGGFTSIFLAWNVYHLVNKSKDLYDGAKTESDCKTPIEAEMNMLPTLVSLNRLSWVKARGSPVTALIVFLGL